MAYCNALGNFVINARNGRVRGVGEKERERKGRSMIAQSVLPFYQILFEVHNCLTLPRKIARRD